jgi:hypothetical protein
MRNVLTLWLSFWRDVLWRASGASTPIANIDHEKEIETISKRLDLPGAARLVENLDQALRKLEANVNARLLAEVLLLDWRSQPGVERRYVQKYQDAQGARRVCLNGDQRGRTAVRPQGEWLSQAVAPQPSRVRRGCAGGCRSHSQDAGAVECCALSICCHDKTKPRPF